MKKLKRSIIYHKLLRLRFFAKKRKLFLFSSTLIVFVLLIASTSLFAFYGSTSEGRVLGTRTFRPYTRTKSTSIVSPIAKSLPTPTPNPTDTPTPIPTNTPTPKPQPTATLTPTNTPKNYSAEKISDTTYKVHNVANDSSMASAQDIFNALNTYRAAHGVGGLSWDSKLADLASSRANTFASRGSLDGHAGFRDFMNNGGFDKAGFNGLGENSAFLSGPMNGDRIIREIFGADGDHDGNQLNGAWTHAAVGVNGNAINVNFGKNKQ